MAEVRTLASFWTGAPDTPWTASEATFLWEEARRWAAEDVGRVVIDEIGKRHSVVRDVQGMPLLGVETRPGRVQCLDADYEAESSVKRAARQLEIDNPLMAVVDGRTYQVDETRGWCLFEAMGNRRVAGEVWRLLRGGWLVSIPLPGGGDMAQVYGEGALYCLTPCSEDRARRALLDGYGYLPELVRERMHAGDAPTASPGDPEELPF